MGHVEKTINGRTYRLSCADGEEARLTELLDFVDSHVRQIVSQFGQVGEDRLLLMAALTAADELWDTRGALKAQADQAAEMLREVADGRRQDAAPEAAKPEEITKADAAVEHGDAADADRDLFDPTSIDARRSGGTYR